MLLLLPPFLSLSLSLSDCSRVFFPAALLLLRGAVKKTSFFLSSLFTVQEKVEGRMGSPQPLFSLHFIKHLTLSVFLIATGSCVYFLSPSFLTVLVMVLPTSLFFAFSKGKRCQEPNLPGRSQGLEVSCEGRRGKDTFEQRNDAGGVCGDDHPVNGIAAEGSPKPSLVSEGEAEEILLDTMDQIPACSDSSASDDDEWRGGPPDQIPSSCDVSASDDEDMSESSISDEESLIEITLPDGHPVGPGPPENTIFRPLNSKGFPPGFSPETVLSQQELLEIFSEMNEEDNLIEIDIAIGSVKCST